MSSARLQKVAHFIREWVDGGVAQTIEVLVARRGVIVLDEVCGRLTPAADSPSTPRRSIFWIASITKLFTATALMTLVEEGRVGLNRPVVFYIPEFKGKGKEGVLVRHLLTHTSGLREEDIEKYAKERWGKVRKRPAGSTTIHPLIHGYYSRRYGAPLWKPPGTEMCYADFNFDLAGEIVRRVSGAGLDRFAESKIFRPLGMADTYYCRADAPAGRRVEFPPSPDYPADPNSEWAPISAVIDKERVYTGSSTARSTALDMAKFAQMFLNGGVYGTSRILSPVTVTEMTRNQIPGIGSTFKEEVFPEASWGYGWSIHGAKTGGCGGLYSSRAFEHWGAGGTYLWVDPDLGIIGVYLSATPVRIKHLDGLKHIYNDQFTDAVTAAVEEV